VFEATLKLILALPQREPATTLPRRLKALFERLLDASGPVQASETEDLIWGLWMEHPNDAAEQTLDEATRLIAERDFKSAEKMLTTLIRDYPEYAEAWNKRATLYFIAGEDAKSVHDIHRTLEIEPRHFGAICGFGQLCLRHKQREGALFAFAQALRVNPHLGAVREAYEQLLAETAGPPN
jgi:Tfp pilus assembly protein PilF